MSKIDDYKKAKGELEVAERYLAASTDSRCDKFGAHVAVTDGYQGYYGKSSCSSWGKPFMDAVAAEFQGRIGMGIQWVVERRRRECEAARLAAESEAREVLRETGARP